MSALWAPLQAPVDERRGGRGRHGESRRLSAVPALPERMARIPFITVLIAIFGVGMVGLLVVNTSLQNQAFESRALNRQAAQLVYAEAELQSELNRVRTPEQIATKASALGMRANPYPAFLVVPSGKVIGEQHRITGDEMKGLIVKTPAQLAAEKAAREAKAKAKAAAEAAQKKAKAEAAQRKAAEKAAEKAAADAAAKQKAAADAAAKQKAAADAAAKQKAAEAAKKKAQQGGGN
jgi:type IV secretory pathway VirB10-like protein